MVQKLKPEEIDARLKLLAGWAWDKDKNTITKNYIFRDFVQAFSAMRDIAQEAERLQHHPEWWNCYNKLSVELTTHDCQGLSELDFELAKSIEAITQKHI